jgi:homoserine/homoserine lactone efflux protein
VLSQALRRGSLAAVWSSLGILAGNAFYFVLSATSLGAIVATSYDLFSVVRWIGAAYLLWLGARTFLGRSSVLSVTPASDAGGAGRMFANGFVLQAANPKALLFFTALLPQFVDPMADVPAQVAVLAVTSIVVEFMVLAAYGGLAGRATSLARRPQFAALTNRVAGSLLIAAGVRTATLRPA